MADRNESRRCNALVSPAEIRTLTSMVRKELRDGNEKQPEAEAASHRHVRPVVPHLPATYREAVRRERGSRHPEV